MRRPRSHLACAALCACAAAGCRFTPSADEGRGWPHATPAAADGAAPIVQRPAPKTVPLEIVFARADDRDAAWQDELWATADEQAFDRALRGRLAANGLRVGLLTGQPPPELAARLAPAAAGAEPDAVPAGPADRPPVLRRFLRLLPGRHTEVVAATGLEEVILLEHDGGEVHGATYHDASAYFALRAWPAADGRVRIELVPTVRHGPLERTWVGEEGAFRLEAGQGRAPFERLAFTATIPQGGTLLVGGCGTASSTVGDAFFRDRTASGQCRRLLAIRPQGRTADPRFATAGFATAGFATAGFADDDGPTPSAAD